MSKAYHTVSQFICHRLSFSIPAQAAKAVDYCIVSVFPLCCHSLKLVLFAIVVTKYSIVDAYIMFIYCTFVHRLIGYPLVVTVIIESDNSICFLGHAALFATLIARTAKDIDFLIESLPSEECSAELQVRFVYCAPLPSFHLNLDLPFYM